MYGLAPVVGILVDRAGHRIAIIVGICLLAIALVTSAIGSSTTGGMIAALLLLGIGWSFTNVDELSAAVGPGAAGARAAHGHRDPLAWVEHPIA